MSYSHLTVTPEGLQLAGIILAKRNRDGTLAIHEGRLSALFYAAYAEYGWSRRKNTFTNNKYQPLIIAMRSNAIKCIFVPFICLGLLAACSASDTENHDFSPLQISCVDTSTTEMQHNLINALGDYEAGENILKAGKDKEDKYYTNLLRVEKILAEHGNAWGVWSFGESSREKLIVDYLYDNHITHEDGAAKLSMPSHLSHDMIVALSYIYVAASMDSGQHEEISRSITAFEKPQAAEQRLIPFQYPITPPVWLHEAKTAAQDWKTHCDK